MKEQCIGRSHALLAVGRRKRTEEVEANSHKAEMVNRPKNANPTTIKMPETHKKSLAEGGAIMSDLVVTTTRSNAGIVGS